MSENSLSADKVVRPENREMDKTNKNEIPRTQEYWENRPEIYLMRYSDFADEYNESMKIAQKKESKGHLDPHHPNYIPMTDEEKDLHARDWKAFSKQRGFNDYDIAEYARWHKISGQTDNLEYAINDPWRRLLTNWKKQLYVKHIEKALNSEIDIPQEVINDFEMVKTELETSTPHLFIKSVDENQALETQELNNPTAADLNWDDELWK